MSATNSPNLVAWAAKRSSGYGNNLTVVDNVLPDMLHLVDPYWYQFPPMHPVWHGVLGFVIGVLGVISVLGNGMVIYIFSSTKSLRTPSNLLVINLGCSDFMMMICMSPVMVINCYNETWVLGPLMCKLYGFTGSLFGCGSIWTMTFIALDRYNVIVKGLGAKRLTTKTAVLRILIIWVMAIAWTTAPLLGWNRYVPEGNMSSCGTDFLAKDWFSRSYILVYSMFVYFTPLFTIIYSYWYIVQAVVDHEKSMRAQAKKMNVASLRPYETSATSAEFKLAKVALMTITLWFFAWTPYLVTNYTGIFEIAKLSPLSTIWSSLFAKANAVYNPIVYGISHPKYRQALQTKFPRLVCIRGTQHDAVSTISGVTNVTSFDKTTSP